MSNSHPPPFLSPARLLAVGALIAQYQSILHDKMLEMLPAPRRSLGLALLLYSFVEDTFTQERGSKKGYLLFFLYFSSWFDILVQYT